MAGAMSSAVAEDRDLGYAWRRLNQDDSSLRHKTGAEPAMLMSSAFNLVTLCPSLSM
jgi:hypothetical protein